MVELLSQALAENGARNREQAVVRVGTVERRLRLGDRRLEEAPITQARAAAEAIELALVQREHHLDREELNLGGRVAHLASFRYVSS